MDNRTYDTVKPFLRWAGGKKWLLPYLHQFVDMRKYKAYYEPFLGGGSVFFELNPCAKAFLSDANEDLINTYKCVKDNPREVWSILSTYRNNEQEYYRIRSQAPTSNIERAARFIYLNHTSYNGLYRVNREGKYNVPYGKRKNAPYSQDGILSASEKLRNAVLSSSDFADHLKTVDKYDLVYLDPPYVVTKEENCFIRYNKHLFSIEDQERLSSSIDKIKNAGAFYILSNAKHETIREIFEKKDDTIIILNRNSLIGGSKAYRGRMEEYLFTNIPEAKILKPLKR